jgi:predicted RNase H-like nuclease
LLAEFNAIYQALVQELGDLPFALPAAGRTSRLSHLKRYEDGLDALICAWVGKQHLLGLTTHYGDSDSSIWVPKNSENIASPTQHPQLL